MLLNKVSILRLVISALVADMRIGVEAQELAAEHNDHDLTSNSTAEATAIERDSIFNLTLDKSDVYGLDIGMARKITFTLVTKEPETVENATLLINMSDVYVAESSLDIIPLTWMQENKSSGRLISFEKKQKSAYDDETLDNVYSTSDDIDSSTSYDEGKSMPVDAFTITGIHMGYSSVTILVHFFNITSSDFQTIQLLRMPISVKRPYRDIDTVFQILLYVVISLSGIVTALKIEFDVLKQTMRRPKAPLVGLFSQFFIMPLMAYGIVRLRGYTGGTALGLFAVGIAPGGGPSNWYTFLLDGDMSVSMTMTLLSTVASLGFMPLWLYTLGATLPASDTVNQHTMKVPFVNILGTIAALVLPAAVGLLLKWKRPQAANTIVKWTKIPLMIIALGTIIIGVYSNWFIFEMFDAVLVFTSAILPYGGFLLGGFIALIARFNMKLIVTIAIETGIQNVAIVIVLLQTSLTAPDSDLSLIPATAAQIMTPLPLFIAAVIYNVYKQFCKKKSPKSTQKDCDLETKSTKELKRQEGGRAEEKVNLVRGPGEIRA